MSRIHPMRWTSAGADSDLRLLMARRGLISSNAMKLVVYEITDAGRAWLETQG